MDEDVSRWVLEFFLRQPIPDDFLNKVLSLLPRPNQDSRFKKTLLLRSIQGQTKAGSTLSETVLENLELIEELDRLSGVAVTDSMRAAYCSVAVCCTVECVGDGEDMEGKFFSAVRRIWRGKVDKMEGKSGLFSDELAKCRDEIETALLNEDARRNLLEKKKNAKERALLSVKSYLEEAWAIMGPPFLESAAKAMMKKQGSSMGSEHDFVDLTRDVGGHDGGRVELDAEMVNQDVDHSLRDHQELSKVGERVESPLDFGQDLQGDDSVRDEVALQLVNQEVHGLGNQQVADNAMLGGASLHDSSQNLDGGECSKAVNPEQVHGSGSKRKKVVEADGTMGAKSHRKKHAARRRHIGRRAEIVDTEDSGSDVSCTRNDPIPSPEVRQVQEALKNSNIELQTMVTDPLPDAIRVSETVRSELENKRMNDRPTIENQNRAPDTERTGEPVQADEANMISQNNASRPENPGRTDEPVQAAEANMISQNNASRPSWLQRNSTARTFEWDDSIDSDTSEGTRGGTQRIHLPTPKRVDCSPLKNPHPQKIARRRKPKKWSLVEEDVLRTAVHRYGKGNWSLILCEYSDIFEERTAGDLKDKWRNMTK